MVVKPDTVSNRASTKDGISRDSQSGSAPIRESRIQLIATMTKPSRAYSAVTGGLRRMHSQPRSPHSAMAPR